MVDARDKTSLIYSSNPKDSKLSFILFNLSKIYKIHSRSLCMLSCGLAALAVVTRAWSSSDDGLSLGKSRNTGMWQISFNNTYLYPVTDRNV